MTALGENSIAVEAPGEPVPLPLSRTIVVESSELGTALAGSPHNRIAHAAAWPLFLAAISVGFVGAHFGKPSYAAHALAVLCLLLRFMPSIRARVATTDGAIVERVTLSSDGIRVEQGSVACEGSWDRVRFYETSTGVVVKFPGQAVPSLLARRSFAPTEYAALVALIRGRARRASPLVDRCIVATMVVLVLAVGVRTWYLEP